MGAIRKGRAGMARLIWDLEERGPEACPRLSLIRQAPGPRGPSCICFQVHTGIGASGMGRVSNRPWGRPEAADSHGWASHTVQGHHPST